MASPNEEHGVCVRGPASILLKYSRTASSFSGSVPSDLCVGVAFYLPQLWDMTTDIQRKS